MNDPKTFQLWYTYQGVEYCETFSDEDVAQDRMNALADYPADYTNLSLQVLGGDNAS